MLEQVIPMTRLADTLGGCRVVFTIASALLILSLQTHAVVLQDVRLGLSDQRTRVVYQFDQSSAFDLSYDASTIKLTIDSLKIPDKILDDVRNLSGGFLKSESYVQINGKTVFELRPVKEFHVRYFELAEPQRLVVDIYPKQMVEAATPKPTQEPVAEKPKQKPVKKDEVIEPETMADKLAEEDFTEEAVSEPRDTTTIAATEEIKTPPPPVSQQETTKATQLKQSSAINPLFILLPALIVVLLLIGIVALKRASKRAKMFEREPFSDEDAPLTFKLDKLVDEEEGEDQKEEQEEEETLESVASKLKDKPITQDRDFSYFPEEASTETIEREIEVEETEEDSESRQPLHPPGYDEASEYDPSSERTYISEEPDDPVIDPEAPEEVASAYQSIVTSEEEARRLMHKIEEEKDASLDFEDGKLTWPVHILDGERHARIMIIDDEEEIVSALEEHLTHEHHEVWGTTSPTEALEKYTSYSPDLLILDVVMPESSGIEFVQQVTEKEGAPGKVIFLSGRTERDTVAKEFSEKLDDGSYEFFRKPLSFVQILGRIRDYFSRAQFVLEIDLTNAEEFSKHLNPLTPHQLVTIQQYLWSKIFEIAADYLGRRIEQYYITDRMEPPTNYMRRVGCQEREDYCIANICFGSNPVCAADKLRGELEVMRQIIVEMQVEYQERLAEEEADGEPQSAKRRQKKSKPKETADLDVSGDEDSSSHPPPRKTLRRLVSSRNR